jgi:hypothetical protein
MNATSIVTRIIEPDIAFLQFARFFASNRSIDAVPLFAHANAAFVFIFAIIV